MNDLKTKSLEFHVGGKVEIKSKVKLDDKNDLSLAYSPGVAYPCLEIAEDKELAYRYTSKHNTIAVITDGSAVLGLGDIGRSEEHTSELQSRENLVCRLLLENK